MACKENLDSNRLVEEDEAKTDKDVTKLTAESSTNNVPLFDASKMGFNDRAWNDPPPLLINNAASVTSGNQPRPKLTSRVAFPLDFAQQQAAAPPQINLNPNAPPPMSGFVKLEDSTEKSSEKSSETS